MCKSLNNRCAKIRLGGNIISSILTNVCAETVRTYWIGLPENSVDPYTEESDSALNDAYVENDPKETDIEKLGDISVVLTKEEDGVKEYNASVDPISLAASKTKQNYVV